MDDRADVIQEHLDWAMANGWSPCQVIESVGLAVHPFKLYTWANAREALETVFAAMTPPAEAVHANSAGEALQTTSETARKARARPRRKANGRSNGDRGPAEPTGAPGRAKFKTEGARREKEKARAARVADAPLPEGKTEADLIAEFLADPNKTVTKCPPGYAWGTGFYDHLAR